jgi:multidrug efflux pump
VIATGAGWEMRRSLGIAVLSGMIGVTLFGIFLTPVFYYVLTAFGRKQPSPKQADKAAHSAPEPIAVGAASDV